MPQYICIDLKSFYASAECVARGFDPLNTNLVVADESRTDKTICLAVTPPLKKYGVPGRPRLFEVIQKVKEINSERKAKDPYHEFTDSSVFASELDRNSSLKVDYIVAPPRMKHYMDVSNQVFSIYLRYVAPEDIHIYSVDEAFIDATGYLQTYNCTAHEFAMTLIRTVLQETGITATVGVGTNMYLAKVAMDIVAKKMPPDEDGVRIAELDELSFRDQLWDHTPITDFWMTGSGTADKLAKLHLYTMGDIARFSETHEDELFKVFHKQAEYIIDHAWGYEPCTMAAIKNYTPKSHSVSQGQVLSTPYTNEKACIIVREMTEWVMMSLVEQGLITDQIGLSIGYDHSEIPEEYDANMLVADYYGRLVPKPVHGTVNLPQQCSSTKIAVNAVLNLFAQITDPSLLIRKISVVANRVIPESDKQEKELQFSLFDDPDEVQKQKSREDAAIAKESRLQKAMLELRSRFGNNAVLKGINFLEGATAIARNGQVGGHKA